jgi:hypothetical protein
MDEPKVAKDGQKEKAFESCVLAVVYIPLAAERYKFDRCSFGRDERHQFRHLSAAAHHQQLRLKERACV